MQTETFIFNKDLSSIEYIKNICDNYKPENESFLINLIPDILECLSEKSLFDETQNLINLIISILH